MALIYGVDYGYEFRTVVCNGYGCRRIATMYLRKGVVVGTFYLCEWCALESGMLWR